MKKIVGLAAFAVLVLFSFQNCNKATFHSEMAGRVFPEIAFSVDKQNISEMNVGAIQFFISDSKVVTQAGNTYELKFNKVLELNMDSGELIESNDVDSAVGQYCVPSAVMAEMTDLLKNAQVCREKQNLPEGTVCAQVYQMPYAKLMTSNSDVDLGTATDSCNNNKTDLCGDAKVQFQAMIIRLNASYAGYVCP